MGSWADWISKQLCQAGKDQDRVAMTITGSTARTFQWICGRIIPRVFTSCHCQLGMDVATELRTRRHRSSSIEPGARNVSKRVKFRFSPVDDS